MTRLEELKAAYKAATQEAEDTEGVIYDAAVREADAYEAYKFACAAYEEINDFYLDLYKKVGLAKMAYEEELDKTVD